MRNYRFVYNQRCKKLVEAGWTQDSDGQFHHPLVSGVSGDLKTAEASQQRMMSADDRGFPFYRKPEQGFLAGRLHCPTQSQRAYLNTLPVYRIQFGEGKYKDHPEACVLDTTETDPNYKGEQYYLGRTAAGGLYLCDSQGYDYARYMVQLVEYSRAKIPAGAVVASLPPN